MNILQAISKWLPTPEIHADESEEKKEEDDEEKAEEEEEEELKDPMEELREECSNQEHISKLYDILNECNDRVNSKTETKETCEQELFDFLQERDDCVSKTLFDHLV
uniref:Ubiquinol-cytochrome C reductase hinge domain-containing protein n=1 Tax=Glossina brevipalpis TaxID=37001 RepID=A0A1A9X4E8_9MUSC